MLEKIFKIIHHKDHLHMSTQRNFLLVRTSSYSSLHTPLPREVLLCFFLEKGREKSVYTSYCIHPSHVEGSKSKDHNNRGSTYEISEH